MGKPTDSSHSARTNLLPKNHKSARMAAATEGFVKPSCSWDRSYAMKWLSLGVLFLAGVLTLAGC